MQSSRRHQPAACFSSAMLNPTIILSCSCIIFFTLPVPILSRNDTSYYNLCSPFQCGDIKFSFPFSLQRTFGSDPTDYCGIPGYQITCDTEESPPLPKLMLSSRLYEVKNIFLNLNQSNLITLVDTDLIGDIHSSSCRSLRNLTIPESGNYNALGLSPLTLTNLTFAKCPPQVTPPQLFMNQISFNYSCSDDGNQLYLWKDGIDTSSMLSLTPRECKLFMVPASKADVYLVMLKNVSVAGHIDRSQLTEVLAAGFPLQWKTSNECESCQRTSGHCGLRGTNVVCFCRDSRNLDSRDCNSTKGKSKLQKIIIGVASGSCSVGLIVILLLVYKKRVSLIFSKGKNQNISDGTTAKEFIQTYRSSLLNNYSYRDIKKMTNGFRDKLGEGGYGNVYKGNLFDGHLVAVKMMKSDEIISDNFINEVATIGRIHHVNVINLLGFCWDGTKRALIYEYMSNGSLADLLSKEEVKHSLQMSQLIEIAIGVAHGIEYLHNGCESRILHLDIKPQNVLLDQNLNPKISDFGLAKLYSRNKSNVTMTAARGTIGYIAPEIFMRNLGNPSHKSDVYSYGMLLLEMVGGRKHFKAVTSTSGNSEAYFPDWVYDKLIEEKDDMVQGDFVVEEDYLMSKKMLMVGLWCIQINNRDRPSMKTVVEMLCGRIEDMEMPPKPVFLFSSAHQEIDQENEITTIGSDSSVLPLTHESLEIIQN